ncbi:labd-13Z-ene-9,15,16-triol synthase, chloroplastic-like [Tasmannia lanceolata]|uniref:labd-13Z-ene-9,15,16-triol synthase, chloroplastic-like n=1 Tax=Tasmannia lanceolata TaxID=3420 RepID=UPI0040648ED1
MDVDMGSNVVAKLRASVSQGCSWLWEEINQKEETKLMVCVALVIAIIWYAWMAKKLSKEKLKLPPGPQGLPLVGNLPFLDSQLHIYFTSLAKNYGSIIKVWLGSKLCVVVSSPSMAQAILKDHDTIFANRHVPVAALSISYGCQGLSWSPYGPHLTMLRKVCVREIMNKRNLDSFYTLRRREVRQMVSDIYAKIGTPVNFHEQMFVTSLNVIMSMIWGGTLDEEERHTVGLEFRRAFEEVAELVGTPNVSDLFPVLSLFDLQGIVRKMKKVSSWLDRILNSVIDQRLKKDRLAEKSKKKEGKEDFLQLLLGLIEEGDPKTSFTVAKLKGLLVDLLSGATDTTSTTVEWAMAEMMKHPEIMRRAQEELEEVVGKNNVVEEFHLPKLSYLGAILKEVLRLHPLVPFLIPRRPSQSCAVGGYMIPKGAQVLVNVWALHRDPKAWENPLEFQPERFLNTTNKYEFNGNNFSYLPFGSGKRMCVGVPMAERMLIYVLASLLHSFEWRLAEGEKLDLSEKYSIILKKETPLIAIPMPRLSIPELCS